MREVALEPVAGRLAEEAADIEVECHCRGTMRPGESAEDGSWSALGSPRNFGASVPSGVAEWRNSFSLRAGDTADGQHAGGDATTRSRLGYSGCGSSTLDIFHSWN